MADLKNFKALITAGGIGTRLLPFSKEIPKEMSPIIVQDGDAVFVKPIIQAIFEQLYNSGIRDFFFVVGRGKRAIEDHFTIDMGFLETLKGRKKIAEDLESFYDKLRSCDLVFVNQPEPLGFGDAVLRAEPIVSGDFVVCAGDTFVISENDLFLERLRNSHEKYKAHATVLMKRVKDPSHYGVILGQELEEGVMKVDKAIEKPDSYVADTAIMPVYLFKDSIFSELSTLHPGKGGEVQLTDAIEGLVLGGKMVVGVELGRGDVRLDIGSPETFIEALELTSKQLRVGKVLR